MRLPGKIILSAAVLAAAGFAALYFMGSYKSGLDESSNKKVITVQQEAVSKLESAQEELKGLLRQNENVQGVLEKDLESEKKRFSDLQGRFWEVISQNKALIRKVDAYKAQEAKELELEKKLQENIDKNQELGKQLLALKKKIEVDSAMAQNTSSGAVPASPAAPVEVDKKLAWLKTKDELNQVELNRRQEHILALQDKIQKMEEKLSLAMEQFKEMEKDSAMLRERNIALQLERESLMMDLNRTRAELGQMQDKLSEIGQLLLAQRAKEAVSQKKTAAPETALDDIDGKKVDVELFSPGAAAAVQGMKK